MADFDNTNRGVLFKNDKKESDKHPDYRGNMNVDGVEHWLDAWIKEGKNGKFMSLSIKPKDAKPAAKPTNKTSSRNDEPDDDIPF